VRAQLSLTTVAALFLCFCLLSVRGATAGRIENQTASADLFAKQETVPPASTPTAKEIIEGAGVVSGNLYENSFFELSYEFPRELKVMGRAETRQVVRTGHEAAYGNKPENDAEHRAAEKQNIFLLNAVGARPTVPAVPESITLMATDVSAFPSVRAKDVLFQLVNGMSSSPVPMQLLHPVGEHRSGKVRFAKAEIKGQLNYQGTQLPFYTTYMGVISKGYALVWMFTASDDKRLKLLAQTIDSVRFENLPRDGNER
jgi:hypothetical protein